MKEKWEVEREGEGRREREEERKGKILFNGQADNDVTLQGSRTSNSSGCPCPRLDFLIRTELYSVLLTLSR